MTHIHTYPYLYPYLYHPTYAKATVLQQRSCLALRRYSRFRKLTYVYLPTSGRACSPSSASSASSPYKTDFLA